MKTRSIIALIAVAALAVVVSCVKDLEEMGVSEFTEYIGTVVEKSTMQPIEGVKVQVTDGTHVHASTETDGQGRFVLKDINFDEVEEDYYLWLDGTTLDLPSTQEPLKGLGRKLYDYKSLILYDKTNVELLPKVTTEEVTAIMALSASVKGNVISDGDHEVTERGVCVATHQTPTLEDSVITAGTGIGSYTCALTRLTKATTYYLRAYATNSIGTTYGAQKMFTTQNGTATISTTSATEVASSSALVGGSITNDGGAEITARGICYGKTENPTLSESHTTDGSGTGTYTHRLEQLSINTRYYYRAYATNACGTTYGSQKSFTTTNGLPVLTTTAVTNVTATSAKGGGNITNNGGASVTARGICWNTTGNPDINDDHTTNGSGDGAFTGNMTNLTVGTIYHVRAYATNRNGTSYGNDVTFSTLSGNIMLTTTDVSNITATTATSGGNITDNGGIAVTERGICWNTTGSPDINGNRTTNGSGNGSFTSSMTGLSAGTTYHVRAYATNSKGTSYGNERTFNTSGGSVTMTIANATNITASSASCNVTISDDGGATITSRGICWSTSQYPTTSNSKVTLGSGTGTFVASMSDLTPSTTYYVRAYAINSVGTSYSNQISFTTNNGLPTVSTGTVSDITATTATCSGSISNNGGFSVTARGICWNTTGNPSTSNSHTTNGIGSGSFSGSLTGLSAGTTYHVRAYATNSVGTSYGNDITFSTSSGSVTITISNPTNITAASALCSANITNDGGSSVTERGICWSTSQYPTISGTHSAAGSGTGQFSVSINGLTPSTTYYLRAYATNLVGTSYSSQVSLTTANGMPTVTTGNITNITATTAVCSGNVTADGGFSVTAKGFCWSTNQYPTINEQHNNLGTGTGAMTSSITGLTRSTTYYVRAYATNAQGTSYGSQQSFTTASGLPTVTTTAPTLNGTTVATGGNVTSDGGFAVTTRGICYGNLPNPDLSSAYNHTTNGNGTGYFSSSFSLPNGSGTYYIRAYATNANGTSYGGQVTVIQPYDNLPSFTYNGHTYKVAPDPGIDMNYSSAQSYCNDLTLYGFSDWRMPDESEMLQMCALKNSIGGFQIGESSGGGSYFLYWTSTYGTNSNKYVQMGDCNFHTYTIGSTEINTLSSYSGYFGNYLKYLHWRVRPIRIDN